MTEIAVIDPGEREPWASRFLSYLHGGPGRTLLGTYKQSRPSHAAPCRATSAPNSWQLHADKYRWRERAAHWDAQQRQRDAEQYRQELDAHRQRAAASGQALFAEAARLLAAVHTHLDTMEFTPAALGVAARALTVALDLEAHALGLERLLRQCDDGD